MEKMENLQYLLKEINIVRESWLRKHESDEQFNVFTTLLCADDEVCLHSRFISSLLDPQGPHKMGLLPLKLFLRAIGSEFSFEKEKGVEVIPNNRTWTEYKEIDILIRDTQTKKAIIIENKINARDSNHVDRGQLEGYYQQIHTEEGYENIEVYYLTVDGHEPSEASVATNKRSPELQEKVRCIDYPNEIKNWLESLAKEAYDHPNLRETIIQYIKLINKMTGEIEEIEERKELAALVGKTEDNLQSTKMLITNINHIYWHTIDDFNNEMLNALCENNIKIASPDGHAGADEIDIIVHGGPRERQIEFWYCMKDDLDLTWTLQTDYDDGQGFYLGVEKCENNGLNDDIKKFLEEYTDKNVKRSPSYPNWYFWIWLSKIDAYRLYFWDFCLPDTDTFDLISPAKRKIIIEKMVEVIKQQMVAFKAAYEEFVKKKAQN